MREVSAQLGVYLNKVSAKVALQGVCRRAMCTLQGCMPSMGVCPSEVSLP